MRAVLCSTLTGPDALTVGELPAPSPGPGEVAVDVHIHGELGRFGSGASELP